MLWLTPVFVAFFLYFATKNLKNKSVMFVYGLVAGWCVNLFALLFYIVNHNYYYHVVSRYFSISQDVRRSLSEIKIPLSTLADMMNFGTLLILYCALCFSISYTFNSFSKKLLLPLAIPMVIQFVIYEPTIYKSIYLLLVDNGWDFAVIENMRDTLHVVTRCLNTSYALTSIVILYYHLFQCKVHVVRLVNSCIVIPYTSFMLIFYLVFRDLPKVWINVTTVTDYVTYVALDIASNHILMNVFPYVCLVGVIVISFALYRYCTIEHTFHNRQVKITANLNLLSTSFSVVFHALKNQLICIEEELIQLQENINEKEKLLQGIADIQKYTHSMFDSISYLHSKLKIQRMELELISLTELCCDIIEDLSRSKEYFPLYSDIPKRDIKCFAAKKQLRECILNLLRNAQEAIHPQDGEIWFKLDQEKNWAVITIIDNGCGISKLEQERIFHPFYSTKTSSKNWGIGLSVCSQIIEAHGGKLMVDSVMGMGSTFRILLSTIY